MKATNPNPKKNVSELLCYPKDSLGFHLGCSLFRQSKATDAIPNRDDVYRVLLLEKLSNSENFAMHYYLCGNGAVRMRTVVIIVAGAILYPHRLPYFFKKFRDGKNALRFYDLDHFRMLHLPLTRIKDTFLIR